MYESDQARTARRLRRGIADAVVDPSLSGAERQQLMRKITRQESEPASTVGCLSVVLTLISPIVLAILHAVIGLSWWWMFAMAAPAALGIWGLKVADPGQLNGSDLSRLVDPEDLDVRAKQLLRRAQEAIADALHSSVYARNLVERAVGESTLRRHEWEIATALRDISNEG